MHSFAYAVRMEENIMDNMTLYEIDFILLAGNWKMAGILDLANSNATVIITWCRTVWNVNDNFNTKLY